MTWQQWVLLGWYAIAILITVGTVGKPREPLKPSTAVVSILIYAGFAALVVTI